MANRSEETRWFVIALIGGQAGAALGLLFLGGMLFMPIFTALLGAAVAPLGVLARDRLRQRVAGRYLRTALRS
jgi:uncharacterized membrane-anchored protein